MRTSNDRSRLRPYLTALVIRLVVTYLMLAPSQSAFAQTITNFQQDPIYNAIGFVRTHWATSINKMLLFLLPGKETSIRAFDPVTNQWEFLWPSNTLGIQGRDNFASFYIPRLDELWVWDGSYLQPGEFYSGRFNVSQKRWVDRGLTDTGAFTGIVDMSATGGAMPFSGTDPAMAWAANVDMGLMLGGSGDTGQYTFIYEPKPQGPEPYKVTRLTIPRPPYRQQCMNCMVSDGTNFYLSGGFYQLPNDPTWYNRKDLWKFDTTTRTWTQLASPPDIAYAPAVTYDSDRRALVSWVKNKLYVYDIASNQWSDRTPAGLPCVSNQTAVYAPTAKLHLFMGGNDCTTGNGTYMTLAISLSGTTQPLSPVMITTSAPTLASSAAALTQNSTQSTSPAPITTSAPTLASSAAALTQNSTQSTSPAQQSGCESEGGLAGRTDILKCEGWETSTWWQGPGWWAENGSALANNGTRTFQYGNTSPGTSEIVSSGCISGNCLKVNMQGWRTAQGGGYFGTSWIIPGQGGCSHDVVGCIPQQEVYLRYYIKLSPNFDPHGYSVNDWKTGTGGGVFDGGGGKFPGLADATTNPQCGNGGEGPTNGTECWSLRMTYQGCEAVANGVHNVCIEDGNPNASTRFGLYPYLYNNGQVGGTRYSFAFLDDDGRSSMDGPCSHTFGFGGGKNGFYAAPPYCGSGVPGLLNDRWYLFEQHVKMNTPGVADGVIEAWIDGVQRYSKTNVIFRNVGHNNIGVRQFWLDIYEGGTGLAMKEDMAVYFDQMVIATGGRPGAWILSSGTPPPPPPVAVTPQPDAPITVPPTRTPARGPAGYTFCATENQTCSFSGSKSVAYGANNNFAFLKLTGGTPCTNAVFGDPISGTVKACYVSDVPTQAPPPPQGASRGPAGYTFCATENQTCSFSGSKSVAYGANNKFTFLNLPGGTLCTNAVFGDPILGTVKACYVGEEKRRVWRKQ
jgi:hypothetical protein